MTDQLEDSVVAHVPITISIDVEQLLASELGWRSYNAGSYEEPELEYAPGGSGRIIDVVASKLAEAIKSQVADEVRLAVREAVLSKVDGLIDEVMSGSVTLTSSYGEAKSPSMSMREAMIKAMTDRLEQKVGHDGKRHDGYGSAQSYLSWHADRIARDVLDKELSAKISAAAKQIKSLANDLVGKKIAEALDRGF